MKNSSYMRAKIRQTRRGVIISHREYLGDAFSSGTSFQVIGSLAIDAGNPMIFPWLSRVAMNYQAYRFRNLTIAYSSELPTTAAGVVIMCTTENAASPTPTSRQALLESQDCLKTNVWAPAAMRVRVQTMEKPIQYGGASSAGYATGVGTTDYPGRGTGTANDFACGMLFVALNGVSAGTVGELYLDYTVELRNPGPMMWPTPIIQHVQVTSSAATTPFSSLPSITYKGTLDIWFPTSTSFACQVPGPMMFTIAGVTSSATASTVVTVSSGTIVQNTVAIAALGFQASYCFTATTYNATVIFTCASFTNLNVGTSSPLKMYFSEYDNAAMALSQN